MQPRSRRQQTSSQQEPPALKPEEYEATKIAEFLHLFDQFESSIAANSEIEKKFKAKKYAEFYLKSGIIFFDLWKKQSKQQGNTNSVDTLVSMENLKNKFKKINPKIGINESNYLDLAISLLSNAFAEMMPPATCLNVLNVIIQPHNLNPEEKKIIEKICFHLGLCFQTKHQYNDAIKCFSHVITINPANTTAVLNRGMCYHAINKYKEAIPDFNVFLAKHSEDTKILLHRGICYFSSIEDREQKEAIKDFTDVIDK